MLCRIALWDCFLFLLLAVFRLSGRLGRCCVELLYGTVFFFFLLAVFRLSGRLTGSMLCRIALWDCFLFFSIGCFQV